MEEAVVYAVRGALVRVFVPEYHVRGVVHLADRDGVALPPPTSRVRSSLSATRTTQARCFLQHVPATCGPVPCASLARLRACSLKWCAA